MTEVEGRVRESRTMLVRSYDIVPTGVLVDPSMSSTCLSLGCGGAQILKETDGRKRALRNQQKKKVPTRNVN